MAPFLPGALARDWRVQTIMVVLVALATTLGRPSRAEALSFTVTSTADAVDATPGNGVCAAAGGLCTLRAAVQESNASPGADSVTLPSGVYVLTLAGTGEDAAATGDLDVTGELTITGVGASASIIDGNAQSRVFDVGQGADLTLVSVGVRNGTGEGTCAHGLFSTAGGGGICAGGAAVTLVDSAISGSVGGSSDGTGIDIIIASLTVLRTVIYGNADNGISLFGGSVDLRDSTIEGNASFGILANSYGSVTARNVTISGNGVGVGNGAGCEPGVDFGCVPGATVVLNNVTITSNLVGGISNRSENLPDPPAMLLQNSIVAGNPGGDCLPGGFGFTVTGYQSGGHNLVQNPGTCTVTGDTNGDLTGVPALLGPLQDNGGATETHAPLPGSPTIDTGNPAAPGSGGSACEATDQRGVARPGGSACDMGAFEVTACGNGALDGGEDCDDGNNASGDGCDWNCTATACGNGVLTAGEECDDGNVVAGDGCEADCTLPACGNGVITAGEACDDGNVTSGDGCDANCTITACGNGVVTTGEQCDDGNLVDGDCCGATCQAEAVGNPCSDGQACTTGDACAVGGVCSGHSCEPCLTCIPGVGCGDPPPPPLSCLSPSPEGSSVRIKDVAGEQKDRLAWKWQLKPSMGNDFGDPTTDSNYTLCVYGGSTQGAHAASADPGCTATACWSPTASGFKFLGKAPGGLLKIKLTDGTRTKITVSAKGSLLLQRPPLPLATPVTIRLMRREQGQPNLCWDATYDTGIIYNQPGQFKAKSN